MKRFALFVILLFSILITHAQEIKRWKMNDLLEYIDQSDSALVVNFWATFCGPCIEEIPYFQTISNQYKNQKVKLLLVSLDFKEYYPQKIAAFAKRFGFTAEIVWLDEEKPDEFCPKIDSAWSGAMPATLFVNKNRQHRYFIESQLNPQRFEAKILELIDAPCPEPLPVYSGAINDYEEILTADEERKLSAIISNIESKNYAQIVIITTDSFKPYDSIYNYALMIGNCWGIGSKNNNNGIVIVISKSKRKLWISNGYGIETKISDEETKRIIDRIIIPRFKEEKYHEGLFNGIKEIELMLKAK